MTEPLETQQLRLLTEQMPAIVWTVNRDDQFTSILGGGIEPLEIRPGSIEIPVRDALAETSALEDSLAAHHRALTGERSRYQAAWGERIYECSVEPLRHEDHIVGSIGVAVDMTEKLQAEQEILDAYSEGVDCMVRAIESRDIVTGRHVERMSVYCAALAQAAGLEEPECLAIGIAARLHDIGKVGIPDRILLKRSPLRRSERAAIERHCEVGFQILMGARSEILQLAATIALTHHEWYDGSGYPQGLKGEDIPLVGRIAAVADVYDALTTDRPYRAALSRAAACETMRSERGTHFDPILLYLFLGLDLPDDV
jgi:HD-GYP domain-containing protein (c-di-GMP phosphodiesterase class II)